jgi:predicted MFS family arabinose efflux permease
MRHLDRDLRLMMISLFLWGFGGSLFIYIQPLYIASLGASPEQIGLTIGVGGALGLILYIPVARYADRIGRKKIIVTGWWLGVIATAGIALAPDWRWLILGLGVYQLASAAMPAFLSYIAARKGKDNPSRAFALVYSGGYLGGILAPAIGGWLGDLFGMRSLYAIGAVIFALSSIIISLIRDQPVQREEAVAKPRVLAKNRRFVGELVFAFLLFFAIELGQVMVPNLLQDSQGYSLQQIGLLGSLGSLGTILISTTLGKLAPERKTPLFVAQAVMIAALMLWLGSTIPFMIAFAYLIHGRKWLAQPFLDGRLSRTLTPQDLNLGYSFREIAKRLGFNIAPILAGFLYAITPGLPMIIGVLALMATMGLTMLLPGDPEQTPVGVAA